MVAINSGLTALVIWATADPLVKCLHCPGLRPYLWMLPVGLAGGGVYQALTFAAVRKEGFATIARTRITQSLATVGTQLGLGFANGRLFGMLLGDLAGRLGGVQVLGRFSLKAYRWKAVTLRSTIGVMRRYAGFPLLNSGASLLTAVSTQVPQLWLAAVFGPVAAGFFAVTGRVLGAPSSLIGQSVGQAFFAKAAAVSSDHEQMARLTERTAMAMLCIGLFVFGVVGLEGPNLFSLAFGARWHEAGSYARMLAPWFLLRLVQNPLSTLLTVREWQGTTLLFSALECAVQLSALAIGTWLRSDTLVMVLLGWGGCLLALITTGRFFRAAYSSAAPFLKRAVTSLIGGTTCVLILSELLRGSSARMLSLRITIFLALYAAALWKFRPFAVAIDRP
jgi:O-antigen/teichoic acid export membrane protein